MGIFLVLFTKYLCEFKDILFLLRLRDVVDEYLRERVRSDKTNISHEQMEMKKLLTSGENAEIIALQLDIMKVSV